MHAAFAPGTGTPEVGGPSSFQAIAYLRALAELDFIGFDVVEDLHRPTTGRAR